MGKKGLFLIVDFCQSKYNYFLMTNTKTYCAILLFCVLSSFSVQAQTNGSIKGLVIDNRNEEPLVGATIYIQETESGTVTGINGAFSINGLSPGTYTLKVGYLGYQSKIETVSISAGQSVKKMIRLQTESRSLNEVVVSAKSEARQLDRKSVV